MDEHGLERIWLFPTLGMIYEQLLKSDPEGVGIMFRAFNRWLEEDWGYNYQDRIFAAPYISLADPDEARPRDDPGGPSRVTILSAKPAAPGHSRCPPRRTRPRT